MTGKHDFSNGFMAWKIWENIQDARVDALPRLVDDNRRYLQAMGDYFTDQGADGKPRGIQPGDEFKTNDVCRKGRHRGAMMADLRGTWTARSLNLTVRTHHDGLFRDHRGPCGCGTRGCRYAEEDNRLRTETDKTTFFDAAAQRKE